MRTPVLAVRSARALAVPLLLAGAVAGFAPPALAAATVARFGPPAQPAYLSTTGELNAVAATSARNVWAVGSTGMFGGVRTLIVHWNGKAWKRVPSPSPGVGDQLFGVAATSARSAWAVGYTDPRTGGEWQTLILRWNGAAWRRVRSPSPAPVDGLSAVAATSARNVWAIGFATGTGGDHSGVPAALARGAGPIGSADTNTDLVLHWNGTDWKRVPSPQAPISGDELNAVTATSTRNAWIVGSSNAGRGETLIERWNGAVWKRVPSPSPGPASAFYSVAATSARSAWAVGASALIARWNGTAWRRVSVPGGRTSEFSAVAATSARNVWAVGGTGTGILVVRWNGVSWKRVPLPGGSGAGFGALAATSARNAWAVGSIADSTRDATLIAHWNGTSWN